MVWEGQPRRYRFRGDDAHVDAGLCIGIGGVRVGGTIAMNILEAVSVRAVDAAIVATDPVERSTNDVDPKSSFVRQTNRYVICNSQQSSLIDSEDYNIARFNHR
jgi:hypothetical protein